MKKVFSLLIILAILNLITTACKGHHGNKGDGNDGPDTLKVVTLYGPTSYFDYRGEIMGFDYENVKKFTEDEGMVLDLKIAPSMEKLLEMLKNGEAELAAYPVPSISEYNDMVIHCGSPEITSQVLVQPINKDSELITDVTQLIGKEIYVENNSKYHYRLLNLNDELGGGIIIHPVMADTIDSEDLLQMVAKDRIPLTIVDSDIAYLNKAYYPNLDISLKISLDQSASWAVRNDLDSLAMRIDIWSKDFANSTMRKNIYKKYFERSKDEDYLSNIGYLNELKLKKGSTISPYDAIFKQNASTSGTDWQLLASIGFNESRFRNSAESRFGAMGIMQLMPSTALSFGVEPESLINPEVNIRTAAKLVSQLDKYLSNKVKDPEERIKFVVAAYNSGLGHIYDAIALAQKYGLDPEKWQGNVSEAALLKSKPEYYTDPVVKSGYFRGKETIEFVDNVMAAYQYFKSMQ